MSIKVYIKDRALLNFANEEKAVHWIETNPHMYNGDMKNIQVFSDEPMDDLIIAKEEVKLEFHCQGCGQGLRIWRHPAATKLSVQCPVCGTNHGIECPDVSTPPKQGDEN
jgi:predicted RNA-binding Zn-ribbon protein involved in translation (DUF1610 family)